MPVHDWTRVGPDVFHGFHGRWIAGLTISLNNGILPDEFYADGEQITRDIDPGERTIPDVMVRREPAQLFGPPATPEPGVAVADAPPGTSRRLRVPIAVPARRRVVVRHTTGHRVVAIIEIVSWSNKDRPARVAGFAGRIADALGAGVHALVLDLLPAGRHDPHGVHEAITQHFNGEPYDLPSGGARTMASYVAGVEVEAFVEHPMVGDPLPVMPLFLTPERYVNLPLEPSFQIAWSGTPKVWRQVLEPPTR